MSKLTHLDDHGHARMVDVGTKAETRRTAVATGRIDMSNAALEAVVGGKVPKGDVFAAARIAGIMAAKETGRLIPLCHSLSLDAVSIEFKPDDRGISITAAASLVGKTGVEMEALSATSVALLTIYDMVKSIDKGMIIQNVRLISKTGGKSGDWHADDL